MIFDLFNKILSPVSTTRYNDYNTRPDAQLTIASVSVLFIAENGETIVSVYDNKDKLSECLVQVTLDPTDKHYAKDLGEVIIEAVNQLK
jgi:hypothetical protein